ncbi:MAG: hypothetical protein NT093_04300 [Candidatus Moranbacteria bacterium]|nr:hypothetical protein [Candidatus Moranbacteria bacterium]
MAPIFPQLSSQNFLKEISVNLSKKGLFWTLVACIAAGILFGIVGSYNWLNYFYVEPQAAKVRQYDMASNTLRKFGGATEMEEVEGRGVLPKGTLILHGLDGRRHAVYPNGKVRTFAPKKFELAKTTFELARSYEGRWRIKDKMLLRKASDGTTYGGSVTLERPIDPALCSGEHSSETQYFQEITLHPDDDSSHLATLKKHYGFQGSGHEFHLKKIPGR